MAGVADLAAVVADIDVALSLATARRPAVTTTLLLLLQLLVAPTRRCSCDAGHKEPKVFLWPWSHCVDDSGVADVVDDAAAAVDDAATTVSHWHSLNCRRSSVWAQHSWAWRHQAAGWCAP